jgi:hypothetical protein
MVTPETYFDCISLVFVLTVLISDCNTALVLFIKAEAAARSAS